MAVRSHVAEVHTSDDSDCGLDYVVILSTAAASSIGQAAHADRTIKLARTYRLSTDERTSDRLPNVHDRIDGAAVKLATFADPPTDIESVKDLVRCHFLAEQQAPWEAVLAPPSMGPNGQPDDLFLAGPIVALAFGNTSPPAPDIAPTCRPSSDHLLMSHITYALTALRCKEALITGSLIDAGSGHWSDAMDEFNPGLARWCTVSRGPAAACRCQRTSGDPCVGCLGFR